MITIARFSKPEDAHLFRLKLGAAGIEAYVQDENTVQLYWLYSNAIGGVRVQVSEADLEAVRELLAEDVEDEEEAVSVQCPSCGSEEVKSREPLIRLDFLSMAVLGFPLPLFNSTHRCDKCGRKWRSP